MVVFYSSGKFGFVASVVLWLTGLCELDGSEGSENSFLFDEAVDDSAI